MTHRISVKFDDELKSYHIPRPRLLRFGLQFGEFTEKYETKTKFNHTVVLVLNDEFFDYFEFKRLADLQWSQSDLVRTAIWYGWQYIKKNLIAHPAGSGEATHMNEMFDLSLGDLVEVDDSHAKGVTFNSDGIGWGGSTNVSKNEMGGL